LVGQGLLKRGWLTGYVKDPAGIHLMLNLTHEPVVEKYLDDLSASIDEASGKSGAAVTAVY
jgi:sphinganine-1-phosphate aldolase